MSSRRREFAAVMHGHFKHFLPPFYEWNSGLLRAIQRHHDWRNLFFIKFLNRYSFPGASAQDLSVTRNTIRATKQY